MAWWCWRCGCGALVTMRDGRLDDPLWRGVEVTHGEGEARLSLPFVWGAWPLALGDPRAIDAALRLRILAWLVEVHEHELARPPDRLGPPTFPRPGPD